MEEVEAAPTEGTELAPSAAESKPSDGVEPAAEGTEPAPSSAEAAVEAEGEAATAEQGDQASAEPGQAEKEAEAAQAEKEAEAAALAAKEAEEEQRRKAEEAKVLAARQRLALAGETGKYEDAVEAVFAGIAAALPTEELLPLQTVLEQWEQASMRREAAEHSLLLAIRSCSIEELQQSISEAEGAGVTSCYLSQARKSLEEEVWKVSMREELRTACAGRKIKTLEAVLLEAESVGLLDEELKEARQVLEEELTRRAHGLHRLETAMEGQDESVLEEAMAWAEKEKDLAPVYLERASQALERTIRHRWRRNMPGMTVQDLLNNAPAILKAKVEMEFLAKHMFARISQAEGVAPEDLAQHARALQAFAVDDARGDKALQKRCVAAVAAVQRGLEGSDARQVPAVDGWDQVILWLDFSGAETSSKKAAKAARRGRDGTPKDQKPVDTAINVLLDEDPRMVAIRQCWKMASACERGGCKVRCLTTGVFQDTGKMRAVEVKVEAGTVSALDTLFKLALKVKDTPVPAEVGFRTLCNALGTVPPGQRGALLRIGAVDLPMPLATIRGTWGFESTALLSAPCRDAKRPMEAATDWDVVPAFKRVRC